MFNYDEISVFVHWEGMPKILLFLDTWIFLWLKATAFSKVDIGSARKQFDYMRKLPVRNFCTRDLSEIAFLAIWNVDRRERNISDLFSSRNLYR